MNTNILFKFLFFSFLFIFTFSYEARSAHLIGADMTFECVGEGLYRVTLQVYRDCAGPGAVFDSQAGGLPGRISVFSEDGNNLYRMIDLQAPTVERIEVAPSDPCQIVPSNLCVERGEYIFFVDLPVDDESYFLVYQRCCRNNTINNIFSPESTGATYFVEITPAAQSLCMDSPTFDDFPPVLICNNLPFEFDHSASDNTEGTQLIYSFYTPFVGGGLGGAFPGSPPGAAFGPNGVAPQPATRPPYDEVTFVPPLYSENTPIAGDPSVSIRSSTGLISGRPNIQGQFVVGVQVEQFFNGQLITTIRRDFQFNVSTCESFVEAAIRADEIRDDGLYVINLCGETEVGLVDESVVRQGGQIEGYEWRVFLEEDTLVRTGFNPSFELPEIGKYQGTMVVNPNADLCSDTVNFVINVFPFVEANFNFEYDTCKAGPVEFFDLSLTGGSELVEWEWLFGEEVIGTAGDIQHEFENSGLHEVQLRIQDENGCEDELVREVSYFPIPETIVVEPQKFVGCAPEDITFTNLTDYLDEDYIIRWDFGDGNESDEISPVHSFQDPGIYDIHIEITSPFGCFTERRFPGFIEMLEAPEAGFGITPEVLNSFNREVQVQDESTGAIGWQYNFNDETQLFDSNPFYQFRDTGTVFIEQIVFKDNGCTDTLKRLIDIEPIGTFYLPNAFTPNGDGLNDEYRGVGVTDFIKDFSMRIYSRWGDLVFETDSPREGWNGRKFNSGGDLPAGVYVCIVEYSGARGERKVLKEFATLIR